MLGKLIRWILIAVVGFLGIGFFLPGTSHVERTTDIAAPAHLVYDQINELRNWENWSPWAKLDPNVKWVYSSPSSAGVGAYYTWVGNDKVGEGKMTILDTQPNESARCRMEFKGQGDAFSDFKLTAKDSTATKVVWSFDSEHGLNPVARWFGLAMNSFIGPDYEKGLVNLKAVCEARK